MASETVRKSEEQSAYETVAAHLIDLEAACDIGAEDAGGGKAYYPQDQAELRKWEEVLRALEPANNGRTPIWLTEEQAQHLTDQIEDSMSYHANIVEAEDLPDNDWHAVRARLLEEIFDQLPDAADHA